MTTTHRALCTVAVFAAAFALSQAQAHHSYAAFDRCTPLSLEGEIDRVVVTGNPLRDESKKVLSLLTEIRRPSDGWSWMRPTPRERPLDCTTN